MFFSNTSSIQQNDPPLVASSDKQRRYGAMTNKYLSEREAATHLGLSRKTLTRWRWAGKGPAFHKFGGAVRYARDDLAAFVAAGYSCKEAEA
jgi:excisionase family DNA binding protein